MKRFARGILSSLFWTVKKAAVAMLALQLGIGELPVWVPIGGSTSTAYAVPPEPRFSGDEVVTLPSGLDPETPSHPIIPPALFALEFNREDTLEKVRGLSEQFADLRPLHRLDPFQLLMQEREVETTRPIAPNRLRFRPRSESDSESEGDRSFSWRTLEGRVIRFEEPKELQILEDEVPQWTWTRRVSAVTRFGRYLVLVQESVQSEDPDYFMVSVVDVGFGKGLGAEQVPVHRVPFRVQGAFRELQFKEGVLFAVSEMETPLPLTVMTAAMEASESAFHLYLNALSPQFWEAVHPLADSLNSAVSDVVDQSERGMGRDLFLNAGSAAGIERFQNDLAQGVSDAIHLRDAVRVSETSERSDEVVLQIGKRLQGISERVSRSERQSNRVWARVALLWRWMTLPRPDGSVKTAIEALSTLAAREELRAGRGEEAVLKLFWDRRVRFGASVATGALLAATFPEQAEALLVHSLEMGTTILDALFGRLKLIGDWASHGTEVTFGFLREPMQLYEEYLSSERVHKTAVGITAVGAMVVGSIGVTHVIANLQALYQDLKRTGRSFVERERDRQRRYYESLQVAERTSSNAVTEAPFTDEDQQRVRAIIEAANETEEAWVLRAFRTLRARANRILGREGAESGTHTEVVTRWQAVRALLFSPASWVTTSRPLVLMKQAVFGYQSFVYKPSVMIMMLLYPKYLSTALRGRSHLRLENFPVVEMSGITIPTELNGGMRSWFQTLKRFGITPENELREIEEWEERIGIVEREIQRASFQEAFSATLEFARANGESIRRFYSGDMVLDFFDPRLKRISKSQRAFLRIYFDRLNEEAMGRYLRGLAREIDVETEDLGIPTDARVLRILKERTLRAADRVKLNAEEARALVREVSDSEGLETFARYASQNIQGIQDRLRRMMRELFYRTLAKVNPRHSMPADYMQIVYQRMEDPVEMTRAARSSFWATLADKPIEFAMLLIFKAGLSADATLRPIQDEMFSSQSWFYLSRYEIVSGFIAGTVMALIGNPWSRLRNNHENLGEYDQTPDPTRPESRSYFRWWWKQGMMHPSNSWWRNQKIGVKLTFATTPAYLSWTIMEQLVALGRVELDGYLAGLLLYCVSPLPGLVRKMNQATELSLGYYKKYFSGENERLGLHPLAMQWKERMKGWRLFLHEIKWGTTENVLWMWLSTSYMMEVPGIGKRALSRLLHPSLWNFTEQWVYWMEGIRDWARDIPVAGPVVDHVLHRCEVIFSNGFNGFERVNPPTPPR